MSASEELPHQTFERLVEEGGLGTLERLPRNCLATYAYRGNGCEEGMVVPLKFVVETKAKRWNWANCQWRGVTVNWITSEERVLIIDTKHVSTFRTRTSTILRQFGEDAISATVVAQVLMKFDKVQHRQALEEILRATRYEVISREQILATRESTNLLEADAHSELMALLGTCMLLTPEKCKADFVYTTGDKQRCMPVQTKSATLKKDGKAMNVFHNTAGYDNMLLCCRPMRRLYLGTVVLPGKLAPKDFRLTVADDSLYGKFIVPDPILKEFMSRLYCAISNAQTSYTWPSGFQVDISTISLQNFESLCIPEGDTNKMEHESCLFRQSHFPYLRYEYPRVQASAVDIIINGVRVQDKHGHQREQERYVVPLSRKSGRNGERKGNNFSPYCEDDFDCLWVHLNQNRRFFFLIPAQILKENGLLKSKETKGKTCVVCFLKEYVRPARELKRWGEAWTKDYCFDYEDSDVENKVMAVLASCKTSIDKTVMY